jgi:hypothetical protein
MRSTFEVNAPVIAKVRVADAYKAEWTRFKRIYVDLARRYRAERYQAR